MNILDVYDRGVLQLNEIFEDKVHLKLAKEGAQQIEGTLSVAGETIVFCAIAHRGIAPILDLTAAWRRQGVPDRVLIVPQLGEDSRAACKENGIQFIDSDGNCYLNFGGVRMYVDRVLPASESLLIGSGKAFQTNGLKLLLAIYQQPALLNATYRDISAKTGISLGALTPIFEDLRVNDFLIGERSNNTLSLFNEIELTKRFAYNFLVDVRPKLYRGQFYLHDSFDLATLSTQPTTEAVMMGGMHAAELRGNYLSAQHFSLYTDCRIADLAKHYRIVPKSGRTLRPYPVIDIFHAFGQEFALGDRLRYPLVSDLLIYADLLTTHNPRALDAAERLLTNEIFAKYQQNKLQYKGHTDVLSAAS